MCVLSSLTDPLFPFVLMEYTLYIDLAGCISGTYSRQVKARTDAKVEIKVSDVMVRLSEQGADQNQD